MMGFMDSIPSHMDYRGQKLAEHIFQVFAVTSGIIGFIVGYVCQQASYMMMILGFGCLIGCLVTLPPWPFYRRDPVAWQKPQEEESQQTQKSTKKKR